ncbi:putative phospholipase A(1) [Helianthus annuus]|nr:putative phospholipase A(1) [Helianthus annuus]KAJ0617937.1 putative phospholipase A(1) [Helianthus annuus]
MDSQRYDELHGSNNWAGLLDPFDLDLRNLILGYGDLASAAERAFNNDAASLYNGYSNYGKSSFFKQVMLPWADSKYQVTSFIYATAHVSSMFPILKPILSHFPLLPPDLSRGGTEFETNWMGYVAVSNDEYSKLIGRREICVVWRGTARYYEWIEDILGVDPVPVKPLLPHSSSSFLPGQTHHEGDNNQRDIPHVMGGWLSLYNTSDPNSEFIPSSARKQLLQSIKELLEKYKNEKVSITCVGHSLGACLAALSAFDIAMNVVTPDINVSAFIFASPQVGNQAFKQMMEKLPNLKVLSVKNESDIVPLWPSKITKWVNDNTWVTLPTKWQEYVDFGVELRIDTKKSPYLKDEKEIKGTFPPFVYHNLQGMLHSLSGWNGKDGDFDWGLVKRSLGWVNMSTDYLKKEYKIPANWWGEKNKGMVLNDHGYWVLSRVLDRYDHDLPE